MHAVILGANSDIAFALAALLAGEDKADLTLASRDMDLLETRAADLRTRFGAKVRTLFLDVLDYDSHPAFWESLPEPPDLAVAAFGYLGDQDAAQAEFAMARRIIESNYLGAVSLLEPCARIMERRGSGTIVGIGSVAGLRGRKSNYIYGSAKGGLAIFLEGLAHRLAPAGVKVLTVLPGFVRTKMTSHLELPGLLTASPEEVAADIRRGLQKGRRVVYSRWMWRWIMLIVRALPTGLFHKTNL